MQILLAQDKKFLDSYNFVVGRPLLILMKVLLTDNYDLHISALVDYTSG